MFGKWKERLEQSLDEQKKLLVCIQNDTDQLKKDAKEMKDSQKRQEAVTEELYESSEEGFQCLEEALKNRIPKADEQMLSLLAQYDNLLWQLRKFGVGKEAFRELEEHLDIGLHKLRQSLLLAGIKRIDETDVPLHVRLHEILDVQETKDPLKKDCVAQIITPGFLCGETVYCRAKVTGYKYVQ